MFDEPGTAREEAERLVAVVLSMVSLAANAHPQLSTGSAECCVCPLCKVIAAVRDPDPQVVERLATGAGDLAAGMASFLRNVSGTAPDAWERATKSGPPRARASSDPAPADSAPSKPAGAPQPKPMAKKTVAKKVVAKKVAKKAMPKAAPDEEAG